MINPPSAPSVSRPSNGGAKHKAAPKRQPTLTTASKNKHKRTRTHKTAQPTKPLLPVLTIADIRQAWITTCVKAGKDQSYAPYCRCTYRHLERSGWLSSRERLLALERKLAPYNRTHNPNRLPRFVRKAIFACASKLPPLDPMSGKPTIVKLRGLSHGRHSARQRATSRRSQTAPPAPPPAAARSPRPARWRQSRAQRCTSSMSRSA